MHTAFVCFTTQPGTRTVDSDGPLNCSSCNGFGVPGGKLSNLNTVKILFPQVTDQVHLETTGQHVLCFLVSPITNTKSIKMHTLDLLPALLGFHHVCLTSSLQCKWCQVDILVLLLTILGFTRGLRTAMMQRRRWMTPPKNNAKRVPFFCGVGRNRISCSLGWP